MLIHRQGMLINWILDSPTGEMRLEGSSRSVTYSFEIRTEGPNGRTTKKLPVDLHAALKGATKKPSAALMKKWEEKMGGGAVRADMIAGSK